MRLIGKHQALDRFAIDDMALYELGHIADGHVAVPNLLGVHDDRNAALTLVEATRIVCPHGRCQATRRKFFL